jgi:hypothetical protein
MANLDESPKPTTWTWWTWMTIAKLQEVVDYLAGTKLTDDEEERFSGVISQLVFLKREHEERTTK